MSKRIVIVGFGFMGQTHTFNVCAHPDLELAGIVSLEDPVEYLKNAAGNLVVDHVTPEMLAGVPHFLDLPSALAATRPDAVVIATPTRCHYEQAMQAIEAGCSVFLEKPMCLETAKCRELVAAAKAKGVVLMVGLCQRYTREFAYLREAVRSGEYGRPVYFRFSRYCGVPGWGHWTDPKVTATSGGAMFDLAIHDADLVQALFGLPTEIQAATFLWERMGQLALDVCWRYKDGPVVRLDAGFLQPKTLPFHSDFTAIFEKATFRYDEHGLQLCTDEKVSLLNCASDDCYHLEMQEFASCIHEGRAPKDGTGEDGVAAIEMCNLMNDASRGASA